MMLCGNKILKNSMELCHTQNFLHSSKLVSELLEESSIGKDDIVVEIGPGRGIITRQLAKSCKKVYGIEYDVYLYEKLNQMFSDCKNVEILFGDFLKTGLPRISSYKVFSNIPFNITAAILAKLTLSPNPPEDAYIVIQEEAARKYAGRPYNKECLRSLLLKPHFEMRILHKFKNTDFVPVPKVNIVLLCIEKRKDILLKQSETRLYRDFISYVFCRHGKSLKERSGPIFSCEQFRRLSNNAGLNINAGPLDLGFEQWLVIFRYFAGCVSAEKKSLVFGAYSALIKHQGKLDKLHRSRRSRNQA
jgi:23S rRNA (adenine-N6)-dimethyltransferase